MRAVVHDGQGGVRVDDVPAPQLLADEDAIVRVTLAAVCGTDLHLLAHPADLPAGTVLGHEYVGRVEEVGTRVVGLAPGDLVVGSDYAACGRCRWCRAGNHWHCDRRQFFGTGTTFGPALPGAQAELVRVPYAATTLRTLPEQLDLSEALLLGDVLATAYAAVRRLAANAGAVVLVLGGGPVGQLTATCAQVSGAGVVVVSEPFAARRHVAREAGSLAVAPEETGPLLSRLTDGRGADGVIDAVGAPSGLEAAIRHVRRAGTVVSVGVPAQEEVAFPVADAFARELTVGFAVGNFTRDADVLLDLLGSGLVVPRDLLSIARPLENAAVSYRAMQNRISVKEVLHP